MIGSDKIAVITASYGLIEKLHFLTDSARRFGIDVKIWGQHPWRGWFHSHLDSLIELKRLRGEGFTHFLYTDGIDCFFLAGLSEILSKYEQMGEPSWLISGEMNCWPLGELAGAPVFQSSSLYRFPNGGGNMGEIDYVLSSWELLKQLYQARLGENTQAYIQQGMADGVLEGTRVDHDCQIFQCWEGLLVPAGCQRIRNEATGSLPCLLHFHGGYSDPVTGKDNRMEPIWKELGYDR